MSRPKSTPWDHGVPGIGPKKKKRRPKGPTPQEIAQRIHDEHRQRRADFYARRGEVPPA